MIKKKLITVMSCFLVGIFINPIVTAHWHPAYSHESNPSLYCINTDWMSILDGNLKLSQLSIPGTHDTMTFNVPSVSAAKCQSLSLYNQLNAGIRYIDARLKINVNDLNDAKIHHGIVDTGYYFSDMVTTCNSFLTQHSGETILMRVKEENGSGHTDELYEIVNKYANEYPNLFWANPLLSGKTENINKNPRISDIRGKIVILRNDNYAWPYGLRFWQDIPNLVDGEATELLVRPAYARWEQMKENLINAANVSLYSDKLFLTHLGSNTGASPYTWVSGHGTWGTGASRLWTGELNSTWPNSWPDFPRIGNSIYYEGTNVLAQEWIENNMPKKVGIVATDFPGPALIQSVINCSHRNATFARVTSMNE